MTRSRSSVLYLIVVFFTVAAKYNVLSSSLHHAPAASPSPSSGRTTTTNDDSNPLPRPKSSSVTFLYELYEQEIFDPGTNSWTSRRFTQSPITGGGGRDSTSLDPQSCSPPRNYLFDGEWKIDMASESRDGFGWEYYVGKYDGLGRRRRRWVRTLRRVSSLSSVGVAAKKSIEKKRQLTTLLAKDTKSYHPSLLRAIKDQYNFKGFGWSLHKSLIFVRSVGATFRIPLSANFDFYDKYLAAPYISWSTYVGYPLMIATFLNASIPLEAIRWLIGGVIWKVQWLLAVISASIRLGLEALIWIVLWPFRLWKAWTQLIMGFVARGTKTPQEEESMQSTIDGIDEAVNCNATEKSNIVESSDGPIVRIETHIEINNTSEYESATAVVDSPRGGAASNIAQLSPFRKKHLTIFGNEVPTFHRTSSVEYSSTIQERIGVCISWRVSRERGYEYRWNYFYTCLPTQLFWGHLEEERKRRAKAVRRSLMGIWGKRIDSSSQKVAENDDDTRIKESNSRSNSQSKPPILSSFLSEHSSTLGISSGFPLPVDPYFNISLLLSSSAFYYGWLLKSIRKLFELPMPNSLSLTEDTTTSANVNSRPTDAGEKLVSSALKHERSIDEDVLMNSTSTSTELNVANL